MSYDPERHVVDDRRIGSSYLLAAIVQGVLFIQCFPQTSSADGKAGLAASSIVVLPPGRMEAEDETGAANDDIAGTRDFDQTSFYTPRFPVALAGEAAPRDVTALCAAPSGTRTYRIQLL